MSDVEQDSTMSHEHYPYVTRSLLRLYGQGVFSNIVDIAVEPNYGYVARIAYKDGSNRITYGNDLGLNTGAASDLARDKGHSKFMLRTLGINCPKGDEFLLPWWADEIGPNQQRHGNDSMKTADQAMNYVDEELGYPVYAKPIDGSKGSNIYVVHSPGELSAILKLYDEKKVRVAMIEEPVGMPDYRVVILDDELISAYRRNPLSVIGDGESTVRELMIRLQERYELEGRDTSLDADDPRISQYLSGLGKTVETIPSANEKLTLLAISNLSTGGTSEDATKAINSRWVELCAYVAKNFSLRLCGVDLACENITNPEADYSILEVNAAPGLDHYASSGETQSAIVDRLYTKVFNTLPTRPDGLSATIN